MLMGGIFVPNREIDCVPCVFSIISNDLSNRKGGKASSISFQVGVLAPSYFSLYICLPVD